MNFQTLRLGKTQSHHLYLLLGIPVSLWDHNYISPPCRHSTIKPSLLYVAIWPHTFPNTYRKLWKKWNRLKNSSGLLTGFYFSLIPKLPLFSATNHSSLLFNSVKGPAGEACLLLGKTTAAWYTCKSTKNYNTMSFNNSDVVLELKKKLLLETV